MTLKNIIKMIYQFSIGESSNDFPHQYMSLLRSFLIRLDDKDIHDIIKNKTYDSHPSYSIIKNIAKKAKTITNYQLTEQIIKDFDIYQKLISVGDISSNIEILNYFLNRSKEMDELGYDLLDYCEYFINLENFEIEEELDKIKPSIDSVSLLSMHASKGLEYKIVYLISNDYQINKAKSISLDFSFRSELEMVLRDSEVNLAVKSRFCFRGHLSVFEGEVKFLLVDRRRSKKRRPNPVFEPFGGAGGYVAYLLRRFGFMGHSLGLSVAQGNYDGEGFAFFDLESAGNFTVGHGDPAGIEPQLLRFKDEPFAVVATFFIKVRTFRSHEGNIVRHSAEFPVVRHKSAEGFRLVFDELDMKPAFLVAKFYLFAEGKSFFCPEGLFDVLSYAVALFHCFKNIHSSLKRSFLLIFSASVRKILHNFLRVLEHAQKSVHGFCVGVEIVVIFRTLPAHFDEPRVLENPYVVGNRRAGEVGALGDVSDPDSRAVSHLHHFKNEVLAVFVAEGEKNASAVLNSFASFPISFSKPFSFFTAFAHLFKPLYHGFRKNAQWERKSR